MATVLPVIVDVEPLPPLYERWFAEFLPGPIPRESNATCSDCVMCKPRDVRALETSFNPATKCCTYVPEVYNFLAGAALADDDPETTAGRSSLEERIVRSERVTPMGLGMPASFQLLYDSDKLLFGRADVLRCPHYLSEQGGRCGIWKYRNSVCSTWFCKHVRGDVGATFWQDVRALLGTIEQELSLWCLLELGVEPGILRRLTSNRGSAPATRLAVELVAPRREQQRREMWGRWYGREAAFYRECAARVEALSWTEVCAIGGPIAQARREILLRSYNALVWPQVPPRLEAAPLSRGPARPGSRASVLTYNPYDTLLLADELMALLHHFDGRQTDEVIAEIEEVHGVVLEASLVQRLADFRILREPGSRPGEAIA
jgi:hypothetical protein